MEFHFHVLLSLQHHKYLVILFSCASKDRNCSLFFASLYDLAMELSKTIILLYTFLNEAICFRLLLLVIWRGGGQEKKSKSRKKWLFMAEAWTSEEAFLFFLTFLLLLSNFYCKSSLSYFVPRDTDFILLYYISKVLLFFLFYVLLSLDGLDC